MFEVHVFATEGFDVHCLLAIVQFKSAEAARFYQWKQNRSGFFARVFTIN